MNGETRKCKFNERRIVYIVIGLLGSGKSTKVKAMSETFASKGLNPLVITPKGVGGVLSDECKAEFTAALADPKVRRIFIDNCNLWKEEREYFIKACEDNLIEWIILSVGRFTKEASLRYLQYNDQNYSYDDYKRQLKLWSEYYGGEVLKNMESIKADYGYERIRAMKDTRIIGLRKAPNGTVVALGLEPDGSFVRSFMFLDEKDALDLYESATMTGYTPTAKANVMTIGHHYKNSFTPL